METNFLIRTCSAVVLGIGTLSASPGFANTSYTFIGDNFDTIIDSAAVPGIYTTAMNVTGSFELPSALPASFSGAVTPLSFSFTDGRTVFSNPLPGTTVSNQFIVTTNSAAA